MSQSENFNNSSSKFLNDFWLHALFIIPIEFGILHSTPLGPLLSEWFQNFWTQIGFDFTNHAATHITTETITQSVTDLTTSSAPAIKTAPSFTTRFNPTGSQFCHYHGPDLVCH